MAKREVIESDLSGALGATTTTFGFQGEVWEIDLTESEQEELEAVLKKYQEKGRKSRGQNGRGRGRGQGPLTNSLEEREKIRAWAKSNGHEVADRGRIANEIIFAYRAAEAAGEV